MRCPKCGGNKSSVVDSRQAEDGNTIRRRRECEECQHRFTTYERVEERTLVVVKKDGTREQFSRDKIFNGIIRSAQKRPVSSDEIEEIVNRIEQKVRSQSWMKSPTFVSPVFTGVSRMWASWKACSSRLPRGPRRKRTNK